MKTIYICSNYSGDDSDVQIQVHQRLMCIVNLFRMWGFIPVYPCSNITVESDDDYDAWKSTGIGSIKLYDIMFCLYVQDNGTGADEEIATAEAAGVVVYDSLKKLLDEECEDYLRCGVVEANVDTTVDYEIGYYIKGFKKIEDYIEPELIWAC